MNKKPYTSLLMIALNAGLLFAEPVFSGVLDSKVSAGFWSGAGKNAAFSAAFTPTFSIEEYLNLRVQAKIGGAVFYGAFNFIAAAGEAAAAGTAASAGFISGENFAAAIEPERLYLRFAGDFSQLDIGLLRQAFGYSSVFAPADFLNPRNPLATDARPRAVLAVSGALFPNDMSKLLAFAAAPKNPLVSEPRGALAGISGEQHWEKVSAQALYVYETPKDPPPAPPPPYPPLASAGDDLSAGIHRAGLSLKADVVVGLYVDALYKVNPLALQGISGLSAACGIDYSFAPREPQPYFQTLVVMAEYLYSGAASQTSTYDGGLYSGRHYLSPALSYQATNYTSLTLSGLIALDDGSFVPILSFKRTLTQGIELTLTAQAYPLETGEFGREATRGQAASLGVKVSAKF